MNIVLCDPPPSTLPPLLVLQANIVLCGPRMFLKTSSLDTSSKFSNFTLHKPNQTKPTYSLILDKCKVELNHRFKCFDEFADNFIKLKQKIKISNKIVIYCLYKYPCITMVPL